MVVNYIRTKKNSNKKNERKSKKIALILTVIIISLMLCFILFFFTNNIVGRYSGKLPDKNINYDSVFYRYMPPVLSDMTISFTSYLVQGYNGLALAFELPFESTFGVGNSLFLMNNVQQLTNINLFERTYQYKVQEKFGWGALSNWHTAYLWFANDVSFIGVLLVMYGIGFLFAYTWKSYLLYKNPFAFLLINLFAMFFFYISANNQVFSHFQTLIPFLYYLFKFLRTDRRYSWD